MSILKTLLANVEGDLVLKNNVKNYRFTIQGSNFEYSFLGSDVKIPQRLVDNFASVLYCNDDEFLVTILSYSLCGCVYPESSSRFRI